MPTASPRPCSRCGQLGCTSHVRPAWGKRESPRRVTGRPLQRMRRKLFAQDPYCARCRAQGRMRLATIRDHIIPIEEGGPDIESNTQGLCRWCSDEKTQQESMRGKQRHR